MLSDEGSLKLKKLRQAYRESLDAKRRGLEECWQAVQEHSWSKESLYRLKLHVHRLAGSAAPYGFETISDASSELEQLVLDLLGDDSPEAGQNAIKTRITDGFRTLTEVLEREDSINL